MAEHADGFKAKLFDHMLNHRSLNELKEKWRNVCSKSTTARQVKHHMLKHRILNELKDRSPTQNLTQLKVTSLTHILNGLKE